MDELFGPAGVIVGSIVVLINTLVAAYFANKNKSLLAASRRLRRIEPRYIKSLDFILSVEEWAAMNKMSSRLPRLPEFILEARRSEDSRALGLDEDEPDSPESSGGTTSKVLGTLRKRVDSGGPQDGSG